MHWELWDTETGNLVGDYDSEADALTVVRNALHRHGPAAISPLALGAEHDNDGGTDADLPPIIQGNDLVARAQDRTTGQSRGSSNP